MRLSKYGLRVENDADGFKRLLRMLRMRRVVTLQYDLVARRFSVVEGDQGCSGSLVKVRCYTSVDIPSLSLQSIYDRLFEVLQQRWELGWVNG